MGVHIQDGSAGYVAKVGSDNKIRTRAVTEDEAIEAVLDGDAYNINTGLITSITTDSTLLYIKNNEDRDLEIESIVVSSIGGITHANNPYITIARNPTGGNLISDGTAVSMNQNRNFGSSKTLTVDAFKGKVSGTLSGGDDLGIFVLSQGTRDLFPINLRLPKGNSIGIDMVLNESSGTTSYYCAAICYLAKAES
jgi:hypothetical protein